MPIPARVITLAVRFAVKAGVAALSNGVITSKFNTVKIGGYLVEAKRRWALGKDGAISTMVQISKNGVTQEVWHVVSKSLRVVMKHRK